MSSRIPMQLAESTGTVVLEVLQVSFFCDYGLSSGRLRLCNCITCTTVINKTIIKIMNKENKLIIFICGHHANSEPYHCCEHQPVKFTTLTRSLCYEPMEIASLKQLAHM